MKTETATEDKKYNGWTNYETWNVKLWMNNDQGSYEHYKELTAEVWKGARGGRPSTLESRKDIATHDLSDLLKDEFEEAWQEIMEAAGKHIHMSSSVWADLVGAALSEVNWREIAESLLEDCED